MFEKVLIANRGEIAVRIIQTCREMGIGTIALYEAPDQNSLHVRLADECVLLEAPGGFLNQQAILDIAREKGADAIHPGYGFLAERPDFVQACQAAGITFIGPPASAMTLVNNKIETLRRARAAGFATVEHTSARFGAGELAALRQAADDLGYPLVVKSCRGGRGRAERLVRAPDQLDQAVRRAQAEAHAVFGDRHLYLEKAIIPAHQVGVQVLGDQHGHLIHLGEREGSLLVSNRKVIEESPAPCLSPTLGQLLCQTAVELARLFNYQNAGTVEFLVDESGRFYFCEIKARLQVEHPLTEARARVDLVREQIRIAASESIDLQQDEIQLNGWSMLCRINAEDPRHHFLPSPGRLRRVRLPIGPEVRLDTYIYSGCDVPAAYDPLIAKLTVWDRDRALCRQRIQRALEDLVLIGTATNLPLLQRVLGEPDFVGGAYSTEFLAHPFTQAPEPACHLRDLAVAAAILYMQRNQVFDPVVPERLQTGWHRNSRRLPE
ncbi:MAG TPA: biotin carboxylase N-terminal domain-containing protein [Anaerolineae bacterium]